MDIKPEIKEEDEGYKGANNTTISSCDFSISKLKEEPLSELPPDDDSASEEGEEDIPLVRAILF